MVKDHMACYTRNPRRALAKTAMIVAVSLLSVWLLSLSLDEGAINQMKFDLSLWTLIALVLMINLLSFACFIVLYAAYRWVRCDLKPPRSEDVADDDSSTP